MTSLRKRQNFVFSVKKSKREMRKLFGFAFVRITNKDQIVVKDDTHGLCVFKVSSGFYQNHFAMLIEN